ncbi:hypothetical protein [Paraburkholderia caballeronis]|uniref:hypothetical protein n=1 Tax=Paraburkholderia caballeronis TaxID=416943 RepID=UPI0014170927|nr:hypothetical protein [Paraburkholderia caballeronis]
MLISIWRSRALRDAGTNAGSRAFIVSLLTDGAAATVLLRRARHIVGKIHLFSRRAIRIDDRDLERRAAVRQQSERGGGLRDGFATACMSAARVRPVRAPWAMRMRISPLRCRARRR